MTCEVVAEEAVVDAATRIVERQLSELDQVCSSARADSELNRMARGRSVPVSQMLTDVLAAALRTAVRTEGLVDPTVGTPAPGYWRIVLDQAHRQALIPRGVEVGLGAVAGAWAADRAAWTCASRLAGPFLVNVGGNVTASGPTPAGGWQVAIDDGSSVLSTAGRGGWVQQGRPIVTIRHGALATASTRSRGFFRQPGQRHENPTSGDRAPEFWRAVTVVAATAELANAAATAALVLGIDAPQWLARRGLPARLLSAQGEHFSVGEWPTEELSRGQHGSRAPAT